MLAHGSNGKIYFLKIYEFFGKPQKLGWLDQEHNYNLNGKEPVRMIFKDFNLFGEASTSD